MTRSEQIITAVTEELRRRARELDAYPDIRAVTVSIKLPPGQLQPRAIVCQIETERRFPNQDRRS